jgi:plastocyanin domain-containing protein
MEFSDWVVLALGVAGIGWINWYFLLGRRSEGTAHVLNGVQEVEILVQGGYEPGLVRLKRGRPARLVFNRQETSGCSEEVVLPTFGVRKFLPAFAKTAIELTPTEVGTFDITCGMSMLHGKLVVED